MVLFVNNFVTLCILQVKLTLATLITQWVSWQESTSLNTGHPQGSIQLRKSFLTQWLPWGLQSFTEVDSIWQFVFMCNIWASSKLSALSRVKCPHWTLSWAGVSCQAQSLNGKVWKGELVMLAVFWTHWQGCLKV